MDEKLILETQDHLARYLSWEISLEEFRSWFDVATWDTFDTASPLAQQIAGQIDLWLAEFSSGHWTEAELREKLRPLARVVGPPTPAHGKQLRARPASRIRSAAPKSAGRDTEHSG